MIIFISRLIKNTENCPSQFFRAQGHIFKLLVVSNQQSKPQIYFIYDDMKQRHAANPHSFEGGTSKAFWHFCMINDLNLAIIRIEF